MNVARTFLISLLLFAIHVTAQKTLEPIASAPNQTKNELLARLSAAETYQLSDDLFNAERENRAVLSIALQAVGNIYLEEGRYPEALTSLNESLVFSDTAPNRINLAIAYLRQNQLDNAAEEARRAIAIDPDFTYGHFILGNIYYTKEDYQSALPFLERVFRTSPNFEVANALGLTYLHLKELERAKLLFEEVLLAAKKPSAELHMLFARHYERTNYPAETEREIKRALAVDPRHPRANFLHGYFILLHAGSERLSEAGVAFENELKITPEDYYSNFFVGVVATSEGNHEKAIRYLKKAIQLNSQRSEAYLFLAQSQIEVGDLVEAEKNLRTTILLESREPDSAVQARRTHFLLGRLLIRTGRREEGEKQLKIARELQESSVQDARDKIDQILGRVVKDSNKSVAPVSTKGRSLPPEKVAELNKIKANLIDILAQAYHNLGVISVRNGQTGAALETFTAGIKWKPDSSELNKSLGIVNFRASRFEQAIDPLSRRLKIEPDDNLVRRMLGVSYYFTRDFANAVQTLKPIESTIYSDTELAYFYGISLTHLKNVQSAALIFDKIAQASQDNAENLFYAAQGFMITGDHERAVNELMRIVALQPGLAKAHYFMGQSLIRLNRYAEADQAFRNALRIEPSDAGSKYHLAFTLMERKTSIDEAITLLNEALTFRPGYADAHYQLGKIYLELGKGEKAIENLEAAARSDKKKDYIFYQLSLAYRRASRKAEADEALRTYQELKANSRKGTGPMGGSIDAPIQ